MRGLIRAYAWSTDDPSRAAVFADGSGADPEWVARVDALKDILTSEENAGALEKGPLTAEQMTEVDRILRC